MNAETVTRALTFEDMAERLGHSPDWWQRRASARAVPHHRDGRRVWFTEADVDAYLAQTAVTAEHADPLRSQTGRSRASQSRRS